MSLPLITARALRSGVEKDASYLAEARREGRISETEWRQIRGELGRAKDALDRAMLTSLEDAARKVA